MPLNVTVGVYEEFRDVPKVTADGCDVRTSIDSFWIPPTLEHLG